MKHRPHRSSLALSAASALAGLLFAAGGAQAVPLRHTGLMGRLSLGVGYLGASETLPLLGDVSTSGVSLAFNLAFGGYVVPNLALHASAWGGLAIGPSVSFGGVSSTLGDDAGLQASAFGGGLTYFISPIDLYLSGSIGASVLSVSSTRGSVTTTSSTGVGFGFNLIAGRQWDLTPDVGIGLAAQFGWQTNPHDAGSASYSISTLQFAGLVSLTYH